LHGDGTAARPAGFPSETPLMSDQFTLHVNGQARQVTSDPERPLLEVLREDLRLTGTKYGCGEGQCGACTVLIDGAPARSCITTIKESAKVRVETIEGLAGDGLHRLQQAFIDQGAMQCGYCVPGQIMTAAALLREKPQANREEIIQALNGNLCRCCNYLSIRDAVEQVVRQDRLAPAPASSDQ
jgi:isoquinoline 1-oxidoreductase alpha subunit